MEKQETIQGNLKLERLSSIIIALSFSKRSGTLVLKKDDLRKNVYIKDGYIVFAQSNDMNDRIDKILLKVGLLNEDQNKDIEKLFHQYGRITGKILVNNGFLTPQEFYTSIRLQTLEIVCSLFNWERGLFKFKEGDLPKKGLPPVKMDSGIVVYEGLRRMTNWNIIHRDMSNFNQVFTLAEKVPTLFNNVKLVKSEKEMLKIISEKKSIKDIIEDSSIDSYSAMKSLHLLHSMCFIEKSDEPSSAYGQEDINKIQTKDEASHQLIRKKCEDLLKSKDTLTYYQILSVERNASESDIKKAYMRMIKDFHPDKHYYTPDKDFIQNLHSFLLYLNKVYDVLMDKNKREDYDKECEYKANKSGANNEALAKEHFEKALEELKIKEYWRAAEFFKIAARLAPHNTTYWKHLALVLMKIPKKLKEAEEVLLKTIELEPKNSDNYVTLAQFYIKGKMKVRAKKAFEQALRIDPINRDARQGLKSLTEEDKN